MVAVQITRQSAEVLAESTAPAAVTRVDLEYASEAETANAVDPVRITRQSAEILRKVAVTAAVGRVDMEVASEAEGANAVDPIRVTRQSVEVLTSISPRATITRLDMEVASEAETANAVDPARVTRQTAEVLARRGSAGVVVPLALNDDAEIFMHDWADQLVLRSSYLTDVTIAGTGAESRLGLRLKPSRSMDVVWRQTRDEFDANDLSRLDRLYVFLRRLTGTRFAIPLYPDQRVLSQSYTSLDDELLIDTTRGRWFPGARVAVVQLTWTGSYLSHSFHLIESLQSDRLVLTTGLGLTVAAESLVIPMIDCEVALEAALLHEIGCLAEVTVTVDEVPGASQLPATKSDTPDGTPTHLSIPILDVDPDWSNGVRRGRSRQGSEFQSGRARGVSTFADRSREKHELHFTNQRGCGPGGQDFWKLVQFFDTRRGRLRSFWHIDQERIWECAQVTTAFISVVPFGDFDDFSEELQGGQVGLIMSDGTFYVRDAVTVQDVASVYRITIDPALPSGLNATDVIRVARARRVRFDSDEMTETWTSAGLAETDLTVLETLEEKDVEIS